MRPGKMSAVVLLLLVFSTIRLADSPFPGSLPFTGEAVPDAAVTAGEAHPVVLRPAAGKFVSFHTQNGRENSGQLSQKLELPHLVLNRSGAPTEEQERTLLVTVRPEAPPPGVYVTLSLETQHGNPDSAAWTWKEERFRVWEETLWVQAQAGFGGPAAAEFQVVFEPTLEIKGRAVKTPTDYYRYDVQVHSAGPERELLASYSADYAFLLENQWIAPLPHGSGSQQPAGATELAVYYADMFPFATSLHARVLRIPRRQVDDFIENSLLPAMLEAYRTQTDVWGYTWYPEWTSFRAGEIPGRLSVALYKNNVWYHGPASSSGNAGISIRVDGGMGDYRTLLDGMMATFHHELFHNLQRSIYQHYAGIGNVSGMDGAWMFFSEGTAELATSVGQPEVQFSNGWGQRAYRRHTTAYVGREGTASGSLNRSLSEIYPYDAAPYWRFLYEQCGGRSGSLEDPAAGMQVIRRTLETLYSGEIVDISASNDLVKSLPLVMDRVLEETPGCPFRTYAGSLMQFSRAIYMLKVEDGRCSFHSTGEVCGFYDPEQIYPVPASQLVAVPFSQNPASPSLYELRGRVPNSFGIDLLDLIVAPPFDFRWLLVELIPPPGLDFSLQVMQLSDYGDRALPARIGGHPVTGKSSGEGSLNYLFSREDAEAANRLGLIITRLDPGEQEDSMGEYTLRLHIID